MPIPDTQKLINIENTLGVETDWGELHKKVSPWLGGLELCNNIRKVIRQYVADKIPTLQYKISSISELDDESLLEVLSNHWFSENVSKTEGEVQEVLFSITSHIVKSLETFIYQKVFEHLPDEELESKLGMSPKLRGLLIELLKTSRKSDALFIKFLAFSRLTSQAPTEASPSSIYVPGDNIPHTIASLWPRESMFISRSLSKIAENSQGWIDEPGADAFKQYLETLAMQYKEIDPQKADAYLKAAETEYEELLRSQFPIVMVNGTTEGDFYKPPYVDPEMKISISTPDARTEELLWEIARKGMVQSLDIIGAKEFDEAIMRRPIRSVIAIGSHGVNLTFNAVAQEEPGITVFLNEQIRAYDKNFIEFMRENITNFDAVFPDSNTSEGKLEIERMSRSNTVHHEFAHGIYPSSTPEAKKLGEESLLVIEEVKAETLYRCLIPPMLEGGSLGGNKEKWAVAMLGSSCQMLQDQPDTDPYYHAAVFSLNKLFEDGVVIFGGKKVEIKDFQAFYEIQKQIADDIMGLYRDQAANDEMASAWIIKKTTANAQVAALKQFLDSED